MSVTLCFDFGNTRLKCAVFTNGVLSREIFLNDDSDVSVLPILAEFKPEKTILSSVINHRPELEDLLAERSWFHRLSHRSLLPFRIPAGKPETVGTDRLAMMAAAVNEFPGSHILVIGLGSCITYNFINKYGDFLGGGISPGMEMRFRSLHEFTAKLPLVKSEWNLPLIGYDTKTNILSGVILGMVHEIDGIIDSYASRYRNFNVLLTGGDTGYFGQHMKNKIFADPNLIYKGLYAICEHNFLHQK
jgi:type III pantothenate kinase